MRKTMGASQRQLLTQFLVESLVIASIAMIIAVAILEVLIPLFNNATSKVLTIDYLGTLPWLVLTTALVGLVAGIYPKGSYAGLSSRQVLDIYHKKWLELATTGMTTVGSKRFSMRGTSDEVYGRSVWAELRDDLQPGSTLLGSEPVKG